MITVGCRRAAAAVAIALLASACGAGETNDAARQTTTPQNTAADAAGIDSKPFDAGAEAERSDSEQDTGSASESETQSERPVEEPPDVDPKTWLLGGWSAAGADIVTEVEQAISITDFGAIPDDGRSDSQALSAAIASIRSTPDRPVAIEVPSGTFLLTETLALRSGIVLRGQGPESSLAIDLSGADEPGITATGKPGGGWLDVAVDVDAGATSIELGSAAGLRVGQIVEIEQRTNPEEMYTRPEWRVDWDAGSIGELNRIAAIDGATITLVSPLNGSYTTTLAAGLRRIDPVAGIGIEDLSVHRVDEGYGNTISFAFATNVWLRRVESRRTSRAHLELAQIYRCVVDDSVFHDATDFGDGGRAYGISLARHATGCLVTDNTLYDLRHAIIIQLGASGNVIAYNDARGSAGYADRQPRADLSLHGHWPQANLFEGNVFDRVVFADWWGPSGPANTLYRNCVLDHVLVTDSSNDQVIVGNVVRLGGLNVDFGITGTTLIANGGSTSGIGADAAAATQLPDSLVAMAGLEVANGRTPIDPGQSLTTCQVPASARSPFSE